MVHAFAIIEVIQTTELEGHRVAPGRYLGRASPGLNSYVLYVPDASAPPPARRRPIDCSKLIAEGSAVLISEIADGG